ncbi:MAG: hypothetical protein AABP62_08415 [Planctomycetota bacterium]
MDVEDQNSFQELLAFGSTDPTPSMLLGEHTTTESLLGGTNSVKTSLLFGSLLVNPKYQANCVRLESLVHLSLVTSDGDDDMSPGKVRECFNDLGKGRCGIQEDPIEDVFVNLVITNRGSFRVLEGAWESGGFYLQRFLDVLATTPDGEIFEDLRNSTYALLKLSDEICNRFGLERYTVGADYPAQQLDEDDITNGAWKKLLFTADDLEQLGLQESDLAGFLLTTEWRNKLAGIPIGCSPVQQLPLVKVDDGVAFALPSATTYAIRMYLTRNLIEAGFGDSLIEQLGTVYLRLFRHTPKFGLPREYPLPFAGDALKTAVCLEQIDAGRYIHTLLILDDLEDIKNTGVAGVNDSLSKHENAVYDAVASARGHAEKQTGFRKGLTLIVTCGVGRGGVIPIPDLGEKWTVHAMSASDLVTLAWTRDFDLLKLWKVLDAFDRLEASGVTLVNVNGLLNLIGWMRSNDWQVLPHAQVPKDLRVGGLVQLPTNSICDLRTSTAIETDRIGIRHPAKGFVPCRKTNDSFFDTEGELPIYMPECIAVSDDIPFVYRSPHTDWWCVVVGPNGGPLYERWLTVKTWLPRIIPVIEPRVGGFPTTVCVALTFLDCKGDEPTQPIPSVTEIRESIVVDQSSGGSIRLTVGTAFELGMQVPTNISEAVLVEKLCSAILDLAGAKLSEQEFESLQAQIVPNEHARHLHAFHARRFRDYVASNLRESPIEIDETDSAVLRIGLAFRVETREKGRFSIRSKRQSTRFLNAIVSDLEAELCKLVGQFNRESLVEMALLNHERAIFSRNRWMNTAKANLSIRDDPDNTLGVIAQKDGDLSSVIFPSQIIAEIAICEAPLSGGIVPGELDFTRMMNLIVAIAEFGGWSDAIHLDAMPPSLTITALGDIQADSQFRRDVLKPFSRKHSVHRLTDSVESFQNNYRPLEIDGSHSMLDPRFENAWNEEMGVSLHDIRMFLDSIEDNGIERQKAIFFTKKSDLLAACESEASVTQQILESFSLKPRAHWQTVPDGYDPKDVELWRYRRQLSSIRRPILQLDDQFDPRLLIAPGFIRQCMAYVVESYFEGTFPPRHFRTDAMKKWHGLRKNQRGKAFTEAVADELRKHGWTCWTEQNVSTLAKCGKNPDYGDVDVVAWHASQQRLLLMECKDLYHGKTAGEIAEQLRDYRGRIRQDGRKQRKDDLRKHLDRLEILNACKGAVCKTLKVDLSTRFEGWTVFKNPVPMLFSWKSFEDKVQIATFDDLMDIAIHRASET